MGTHWDLVSPGCPGLPTGREAALGGGTQPWPMGLTLKATRASPCPQHLGFPPTSRPSPPRQLWEVHDSRENHRTHCVKWWEEPRPPIKNQCSPPPITASHLVELSANRHLTGRDLSAPVPTPRPSQSSTQEGLFPQPLQQTIPGGPKRSALGPLHVLKVPSVLHQGTTQPLLELQAPGATHLQPLLAEQLWTQPTSPHFSLE